MVLAALQGLASAEGTRDTATYRRIKAALDAIPAIDTHDHLWPFDRLPGLVETDRGKGMNLAGLWRNSYFPWIHPLDPWTPGMAFDAWWDKARHDFDDARATSFYRYQLPAFADLYGVDFDRSPTTRPATSTTGSSRTTSDRRWLYQVVTERANIELMFNDPYWARFDFRTDYPFGVLVFNVTTLVAGFHPSEFKQPADDPYALRPQGGHEGRDRSTTTWRCSIGCSGRPRTKGAVCLKTTLAYQRTLRFENVPRDRAAQAFGHPRSELSADADQGLRGFHHVAAGRARAPGTSCRSRFTPATARIQGSNPMLLVDLIEANPKTKFILFHGGFPWVGETGVIVMRHGSHVWLDSVWLPTLSYAMAKRAFHEWLEVMPSNRIMWGADANHAEGIYGATELTRRCLAEVLAEKVDRGDLREEHALRIGRQILRDNALASSPSSERKLWKHKGVPLSPPATRRSPAAWPTSSPLAVPTSGTGD